MTEKAEFEELKARLRNAERYFDTAYLTDTPENQRRAEATLQKITARMDELLKALSKTAEIDITKTCDEWMEEIRRYTAAEGLRCTGVMYYERSKRLFVKFEPEL